MLHWHSDQITRRTKMNSQPPAITKPDSRLRILDGVRGWAALSVVFFHLLWETFGQIHAGFRNPIFAFLFDGDLAVSIFFIVSGEALSTAYFSGKGASSTVKLAIKRYPRLVIPIFATCTLTAAIMYLGLNQNVEAGFIVDRSDWLGSWLHFSPSIRDLLRYSFLGAFEKTPPEMSFNPFLWTMRPELFGSAMVFALIGLFHTFKKLGENAPLVLIAMLSSLLIASLFIPISSHISCFLFGMLFASVRRRGWINAARNNSFYQSISSVGFVLVCTLDGVLHWTGHVGFEHLIAAAILWIGHTNLALFRFLVGRVSMFLGKISFPIYLVQLPILVSLTSYLIAWSSRNGFINSPITACAICMTSVVACILAALAFEPVEIFTKLVGDLLVRVVLPWFGK